MAGLLPAADVRVDALTARLPVGAQRQYVDRPMLAWVEVLVWLVPGVCRQLVQVLAPIQRLGAGSRFGHQGLKPLFSGGVALIVQAIKLEGLSEVVDVSARGGGSSVVGSVQHIGHNEDGQNGDDDKHHQQFDQGKAPLDGSVAELGSGNHLGPLPQQVGWRAQRQTVV